MKSWWWPHIIAWALIVFLASLWTPGIDPFTPLIPIALGIAAYELGRRWISREIRRRSAMRQVPH